MSTAPLTVEERLAAIEARESVHALLADYAHACDVNDADAVAALFTDDGVLQVPSGTADGRGAIAEWYSVRLIEPTKHHVTNIRFNGTDPSGNVKVHCEFVAMHMFDHGTSITWGFYDDDVRVANGSAAFVRRRIGIDGRGDLAPAGTNQQQATQTHQADPATGAQR